jgi:uracil-DNA glycosylase family 4
MAIDWDALEEIQSGQAYQVDFSKLSDVYVPGEGDNPQAFLIGEAPGAQEAIQKRPFIGPAGIMLRRLMLLAGLAAEAPYGFDSNGPNCWLTNVVKFRPPRNRKPTPLEIAAARPWLRQEWMAVGSPRVIVPIGSTALTAVYDKPMRITMVAGNVKQEMTRGIYKGERLLLYIWPMIHPAHALRQESLREVVERDWERFGAWRDELGI